MKLFKILSWLTFLIIVLVVGIAIFFVTTFDANRYKEQITTVVNKQTGRDLNIEGELKLAFYPDIAIELGKTSLSNASGFSGEHFATVGSGQVSVKLMPLLKKEVKVAEIRLNKLSLNLHRKADGSSNWDDLAKSEEPAAPKEDKPPAEAVQEMLNNLSIAGVSLKEATIHWRDDQSGQNITLSPVNLKTGTFKPGKPLPVELALVMEQQKPAMKIAAEGETTLTLSENNQQFSLADLKLHTHMTGAQIPNGALDTQIKGNVSGTPKQISIPDLVLVTDLTGDLIPEGAIKAELKGNVNMDVNAQQLSIKGLQLNSTINGKPLSGGNLKALVTGDTQFNLAKQLLSIPNLNLDARLSGGPVKDGEANSKLSGNLTVDLAKSHVSIPQLQINSTLTGGVVPGGSLSQQGKGAVDLNWANNKGSVNLSSLLVKLADLELTGSQVQIQPLAERPAVSGQFKTNTFNLKQALKTLGIEPPVTSNPTALSLVQAQFALKADTENADLQQLKLKLDKTSISGSLGVKNFATPGIRPQLVIDTINVDDYLAPSSDSTAGSGNKSAPGNKELLPLDTLRTLDIDGGLKIGAMIINKLSLSNINAQIKAKQGLINIDPANASLYKGDYKGRITLDARQTTPTMNMRHELAGLRSEGLLFDLFQDKYISGDTKLVTELSSKGNNMEALLGNLNGTTSIAFKDGTIRDSNLAEKVSLAVKAFEKEELQDGKSVVKFTGLSGDWKTTNGVFQTDNLSMLSPYFNIFGEGNADIAKQTLDMKLRIGPNRNGDDKEIFAPLRIYGPFSDLKFKLNLQDLVKALAQQDLDKAKAKAKEKLDAEKQALKQKLADEKAAQVKALQEKADEAKAKALKSIQEKAGSKLGDALKQKLEGNKDSTTTEKTDEPPKSVEDQVKEEVKDKLKEGLKGLF